jgi:hypothetical protein
MAEATAMQGRSSVFNDFVMKMIYAAGMPNGENHSRLDFSL